jgi:hypothetical protein
MRPCPYAGNDYDYPPCLGEENEKLTEQISKELKEMI